MRKLVKYSTLRVDEDELHLANDWINYLLKTRDTGVTGAKDISSMISG